MQQSMQISLLCSTEHKEENMIFVNSPFKITAAMLKGSQEQNEKEEKLLKLLLPSGKNNLTN